MKILEKIIKLESELKNLKELMEEFPDLKLIYDFELDREIWQSKIAMKSMQHCIDYTYEILPFLDSSIGRIYGYPTALKLWTVDSNRMYNFELFNSINFKLYDPLIEETCRKNILKMIEYGKKIDKETAPDFLKNLLPFI